MGGSCIGRQKLGRGRDVSKRDPGYQQDENNTINFLLIGRYVEVV